MAKKLWNVAAYTRLCRDDGDKTESDSIGSQKEIIRAFVRDRDDMESMCEDPNRLTRGRNRRYRT